MSESRQVGTPFRNSNEHYQCVWSAISQPSTAARRGEARRVFPVELNSDDKIFREMLHSRTPLKDESASQQTGADS